MVFVFLFLLCFFGAVCVCVRTSVENLPMIFGRSKQTRSGSVEIPKGRFIRSHS